MLAEGLSREHGIHTDAMNRGIECITRFQQRLKNIPVENTRIIATNTLRSAINAQEYVNQLESLLNGNKIDIISGIEEARLIYLGVNHSWSAQSLNRKKLVIDIGGGSTEVMIGKGFEFIQAESLTMGCVAYRRFFPGNEINETNFNAAFQSAKYKISTITEFFPETFWEYAVGSSGTLKAIENILRVQNICQDGISQTGLFELKDKILKYSTMDEILIDGLKPARSKTITPGLAITMALFELLNIKHLHISRGGMREGILYDLVGKNKTVDIRQRSIDAICLRYNTSISHNRVTQKIAQMLSRNLLLSSTQKLEEKYHRLLGWAAQSCRIGLSINHEKYQFHSAYLLQHSELSGFSIRDREILATLVLNHRKKLKLEQFDDIWIDKSTRQYLITLVIILRLAVILGHNGNVNIDEEISVSINHQSITINIKKQWLKKHSLIAHALSREERYWQKVNFDFNIQQTEIS